MAAQYSAWPNLAPPGQNVATDTFISMLGVYKYKIDRLILELVSRFDSITDNQLKPITDRSHVFFLLTQNVVPIPIVIGFIPKSITLLSWLAQINTKHIKRRTLFKQPRRKPAFLDTEFDAYAGKVVLFYQTGDNVPARIRPAAPPHYNALSR